MVDEIPDPGSFPSPVQTKMPLDERLVGIEREILVSIEGRRFGISSDGNVHVRGGVKGFKGKVILISDAVYTLQMRDMGRMLVFTSNDNVLVNVPDSFPKGWHCLLLQVGTGTVRIVPAGNSVIQQRLGEAYLGGQGALCNLLCYRVGYWVFGGDTGSGYPDITVLGNNTFATVTQTAGGKVPVNGHQEATFDTVIMLGYGHNVDTPVSNGNAHNTFATITQTAGGQLLGNNFANQTFATITQTARSTVTEQGGAAQTLADMTQTARDAGSSAVTYYVSADGSDSNDGLSESAPWQSIANVEALTGTPLGLGPGDRIRFRGGDTFNVSTGWYWAGHSGTAVAPIVVDSYGTGKATITATAGANTYDIIGMWNDRGGSVGHEYITFDNLKFTGPGYAQTTNFNGVFIDQTDYHNKNITFSNCEFTGMSGCIVFGEDNVNAGGCDNVHIDACYFHDCRAAGVMFYNASGGTLTAKKNVFTGVLVENCWAETMGTEGICVGGSNGTEIRYCVARDCGKLTSGCVGIWTYSSTYSHIHHCEADHNTATGTIDGDGFDCDIWNDHCIIEYCYAHDNKGADILLYDGGGQGTVWAYNHCRYNLCVNGGATSGTYACILFAGNGTNMPNNYVYNNTLIQQVAGRTAMRVGINAQGKVCNNLIITDDASTIYLYYSNTTESASLQIVGNAYYAAGSNRTYRRNSINYSTLADLQAVNASFEKIGGVNVGFEDNPVFAGAGLGGQPFGNLMTTAPTVNQTAWNNAVAAAGFGIFKLDSSSPYKDAGRNLPTEFSLDVGDYDFFGNGIPAGTTYSIGAHDL